MTNYNDGKWHGWGGGECPVHPNSSIVIKWSCNGVETSPGPARAFAPYWQGKEICALKVIKEHKEPSEWWLVISRSGHTVMAAESEEMAKEFSQGANGRYYIHVREVLE